MFSALVTLTLMAPAMATATNTQIMWMLDDSYSIARYNYNNAKLMINDVNMKILNDPRYSNTTGFGLMEFGSRMTGTLDITYDYSEFKEQLWINRFDSSGETHMSTAFEYVNEYMFRNNVTVDQRIIAIVTDGAPKPGPVYGGPALVAAVNKTIVRHGIDKLLYIMVSNSIGRRRQANPNQFVKVGDFYNRSEDFIPLDFSEKIDMNETMTVMCKLVECETGAPTASPSASPSGAPTSSPSMAPSSAPTKSPTISPTLSPSRSPTKSPSMEPTNNPTPPTNDDDGLSSGEIAGIVLGSMALAMSIGIIAYIVGTENG